MKRTLSLFCVVVALATSLSALEVRVGASAALPGTYTLDAVAEGGLELFDDTVKTELGLELGLVGTSFRALVPAGFAAEIYLEDGWSVGTAVHGLLGYGGASGGVLWGAEAEARTEFAWVPGIALGLTARARYVAGGWEFPVQILVEMPLGPEDKLELVPDKADAEEGK